MTTTTTLRESHRPPTTDFVHDLWIETRGVPWPFAEQHDAEEERLARQVVHAVTGADKDGLRNALEALGVRDD